MDNTELRRIPIQGESSYFADSEGFIWRQMKHRPRQKYESKIVTLLNLNNEWFTLVKPSVYGKKSNYLRFELSGINVSVHRAVLMAFNYIDGCDVLQVNHKNRNTFDNRPSNLEWVTNQENCQHRFMVELPESYDVLRDRWEQKFSDRQQITDIYTPLSTGGQQKYDVEAIKMLLATTTLTMREIAKETQSSYRAVKYWQEQLKIKRPKTVTLAQKIDKLLSENPELTAKDLSQLTGSLITSVHTVLRKRKV